MAKAVKKTQTKTTVPSEYEALNAIIAGRATAEHLEEYFNKDNEDNEYIPRQYIDCISEGIILPRKKLLMSLYRWTIPTLKGIQEATGDVSERYKMPAIKLVCEVKKGHGATTLARKFCDALRNVLSKDTQLNDKAYILEIDKTGKIFMTDPNKVMATHAIPIIVLDGIPNLDGLHPEMKSTILNLIASYSVISFVEDKSQVKSLFPEEPFIIQAENLVVENILEIAKHNGYVVNRPDTLDFVKSKIELLLDKDISPKSILNLIAATSGVSLRDHNSLHKSVDDKTIQHIFTQLVEEHTEITSLESIPLNDLYDFISGRVLGQEDAVNQVVNSIALVQYGLKDKNRPVYSFMFLGKTGVGKTELARTLSAGLFGREDIVRIDMGEFKSSHHVEKLFGSAPGYIGYGTDTKLVREVKRRAKGILLFDEIEKAHPDVHDALLNMLDAGKFTTGGGVLIDITGYIVIMTSNALVKEEAGSKSIGFETRQDKIGTSAEIRKKLVEKKYFSPEFVNRINSVIWFNDINKEIAAVIMDKQMKLIEESLAGKGIEFSCTAEYKANLLATCDESFGGRDVVRKADLARFHVVDFLRKDPTAKKILLEVDKTEKSSVRVKNILK